VVEAHRKVELHSEAVVEVLVQGRLKLSKADGTLPIQTW